MTISAQSSRGGYSPAIPLPLYVLWLRECPTCRRRFPSTSFYRGHYALVHILGLPED